MAAEATVDTDAQPTPDPAALRAFAAKLDKANMKKIGAPTTLPVVAARLGVRPASSAHRRRRSTRRATPSTAAPPRETAAAPS